MGKKSTHRKRSLRCVVESMSKVFSDTRKLAERSRVRACRHCTSVMVTFPGFGGEGGAVAAAVPKWGEGGADAVPTVKGGRRPEAPGGRVGVVEYLNAICQRCDGDCGRDGGSGGWVGGGGGGDAPLSLRGKWSGTHFGAQTQGKGVGLRRLSIGHVYPN